MFDLKVSLMEQNKREGKPCIVFFLEILEAGTEKKIGETTSWIETDKTLDEVSRIINKKDRSLSARREREEFLKDLVFNLGKLFEWKASKKASKKKTQKKTSKKR